MRSRRGLAERMLSASMEKVRYLVLMRPLLPRASWFCSICVVLHPDGVKVIPLSRDGDAVGEGLLGRRQVQKGQLEADGAVKIVEEIAPAFKDGGLVLVLAELVG